MTRTLFRAVLIVLPFLLAAPASAYVESPLLADKVKGGELPPVAERLPANPRVIDLPAMGRQIGKQGGTINSVIGSQKDIRFMTIYGYSRLVGYDEKLQLVPDILDKFTIEDGRIFTLTLRKGHKWSDGQPFTTEDFRYAFENVMLNEDLNPGGLPTELMPDGKPPKFEVIDDLTVRYEFEGPNPNFLPSLAAPLPPAILLPAHYLKQFHEKYPDQGKARRAGQDREVQELAAAAYPAWPPDTGRRTPSCRRSIPGSTPPSRRPSSSSSSAIPISTGSTPTASSCPMSTSSCSTSARPSSSLPRRVPAKATCRRAISSSRTTHSSRKPRSATTIKVHAVGAHPRLAGRAVAQPQLPGSGVAQDLP